MRTYGEAYGPAMKITDQSEADAYLASLTAGLVGAGRTRAEAEDIVRSNLGYWAGYYDDETRARVERLFRCAHPVFGAIAIKGPPTQDQALRAGLEMGRAAQRREGGS